MKVRHTSRGFELIEFKDIYGAECSLQQSSLATKNAIWLGCDKETVHEVTGEKCGARMHLDVKLAKEIVRRLNLWIEKGSFRP